VAVTTARSRKVAKITSVVAGFGLGIVAVLGFSNAAFNAQAAPNASNNWATQGAVSLTSQFQAPMFSFGLDGVGNPWSAGAQLPTTDAYLDATGIGGRDIDITFQGDVNADVRMYVGSVGTATNNLADYTLVTIQRDGTTIYNEVPLSSMPTSWAAAGTGPNAETSHWLVNHDDADKVATYTVSIKAAPNAPGASTVRNVSLQWSAQQR